MVEDIINLVGDEADVVEIVVDVVEEVVDVVEDVVDIVVDVGDVVVDVEDKITFLPVSLVTGFTSKFFSVVKIIGTLGFFCSSNTIVSSDFLQM